MAKKMIVFSGYPGSGKSTKARDIVQQNPDFIRVNRDDLRAMLFCGRKWTPASETVVAAIEQSVITQQLGRTNASSIVIDNTNLKQGAIQNFRAIAETYGAKFEHIDLNEIVPIHECIFRDSLRQGTARVGRGVIDRMALSNKKIDFSGIEKMVIVDLDGTLADLTHRLHYLEEKPKNYDDFFATVAEDGIYPTIFRAVIALQEAGYMVVAMSGRPTSCGYNTNRWLNGTLSRQDALELYLYPSYLFMRQAGDHRPDDQVKRQLFNWMLDCGLRKEAVKLVLDDREQVCAVWRELGLPLVKVLEGTAVEIAPEALQLVVDLNIPISYQEEREN